MLEVNTFISEAGSKLNLKKMEGLLLGSAKQNKQILALILQY